MQSLTILLYGKSGAGKGTQAQLLLPLYRLHYVSTGDLLREFVKKDLPVARRLREFLPQGLLVPSWLAFSIWLREVEKIPDAMGILFDGVGRKLPEARLLDEVLEWYGRIPPKIFLLDISDAEATRRLLARRVCETCGAIYAEDAPEIGTGACRCGGRLAKRHDDELPAIKNRLDYFEAEVVPVLDHYREKEWLIRINGEQSVEEVHREILRHLPAVSIR